MAGLFGGGKSPKAPPIPPPVPVPTSQSTSDLAMNEAQKRSGFLKTLVTGDLAPQSTGKKNLLGG
jgi:hypothetical protein